MNIPAGWYPDPYVAGQMRYWDGQSWTGHAAPEQQMGQSSPAAAAGYAPDHLEPKKNNLAVWIFGGLAAVLVIAIIVLVILFVSGDDSGQEDPAASAEDETAEEAVPQEETPSAEPDEPGVAEDEETANPQGPSLVAGETVTVGLEEDEEVPVTLTVDDPVLLYVYTTSQTGTDPMFDLYTADGDLIDSVDDGGSDSANHLDGGMEVFLAAGEYEIEVSEFSGDEAEIDITADLEETLDTEDIDAGRHDFSVSRNGTWAAVTEVPDGAQVTIDVRGEIGEDAVLDVVLPNGSSEHNDDRGPDAPGDGTSLDPYLEFDVDQGGMMIIVITGWSGSTVDGEMSLEID